MATDLTDLEGKIFLDCSMTAKKALDLSTPTDALSVRETLEYTFGDDPDVAGEADQIYHDQFTIAATGSETINLSTCLNPFGAASGFDDIKAVIIRNESTDAKIIVGGGTWQAWFSNIEDLEEISSGGISVHAQPTTILEVLADQTLLISNDSGSNAATVDVVIIGTVDA